MANYLIPISSRERLALKTIRALESDELAVQILRDHTLQEIESPDPALKGSIPLILYFKTRADVTEFQEIFKRAKGGNVVEKQL